MPRIPDVLVRAITCTPGSIRDNIPSRAQAHGIIRGRVGVCSREVMALAVSGVADLEVSSANGHLRGLGL